MVALKWKVEIWHRQPGPGTSGACQGLVVPTADGRISILCGLEPFHDDESYGIHISMHHEHSRPVTDEELKAIGDKLFNGKRYEEWNKTGDKARHLWEVKS